LNEKKKKYAQVRDRASKEERDERERGKERKERGREK